MPKRQRVLFICTHNSARGHMAGGWRRHLAGDRFETHRAGTETTRVRALATRAMDKVGSNIADLESKANDRYLAQSWECVITVRDQVRGSCPYFPGGKR